MFLIISKSVVFIGLTCYSVSAFSDSYWILIMISSFLDLSLPMGILRGRGQKCFLESICQVPKGIWIQDQLKPNFWIRVFGATQIVWIQATSPWICGLVVINSLGGKCVFTSFVLPMAKAQTGLCSFLSRWKRSSIYWRQPEGSLVGPATMIRLQTFCLLPPCPAAHYNPRSILDQSRSVYVLKEISLLLS